MSLSFCFIGAGNLATHLAQIIQQKVGPVIQVYSRTRESASDLATKLQTSFTISPESITREADIYFVALKDSALHEVLRKVDLKNKLLVHCSGSLPLSVLNCYSENTGVLYPLQTFSKNRRPDFSTIPVFIEANSENNGKILVQIASAISSKVSVLDSGKRKSLHVAAVFASNFVNHFYTLAADYLDSQHISFEVLHPLILETALKAREMSPEKAQTGPAVRFDRNIIDAHLDKLDKFPKMKELYNSITTSIFERHQNK